MQLRVVLVFCAAVLLLASGVVALEKAAAATPIDLANAYLEAAADVPLAHLQKAHSLAEFDAIPVSGRQLADPAPVIPDGYPSGPDQLERYQIVLWLSIVMVCIVFTAIYNIAFMSFKKDTMLYSSFNPNWEDRKRR